VQLPLVHIATRPIRINHLVIRIRNYNRAVRSADGTPHHIRARVWCGSIVDNNRQTFRETEIQGGFCKSVVNRVIHPVRAGIAHGEFMHQNPLVDRRDVGYHGHPRSRDIQIVGHVVYDGTPGAEIGRHLVGEFLAVFGVALVGIVRHERVVIHEQVRLPNWVGAVGRVGTPTLRDAADEFPSARFVGAGVQVDACAVVAGRVARGEDGAGGETTKGFGSVRGKKLVSD